MNLARNNFAMLKSQTVELMCTNKRNSLLRMQYFKKIVKRDIRVGLLGYHATICMPSFKPNHCL